MTHTIRYVVFAIMLVVCSQNTFAVAASGHAREEILPELRLTSAYLKDGPLGVVPLVSIFRDYAERELTCGELGIEEMGPFFINRLYRPGGCDVGCVTSKMGWNEFKYAVADKFGIPASSFVLLCSTHTVSCNLHEVTDFFGLSKAFRDGKHIHLAPLLRQ